MRDDRMVSLTLKVPNRAQQVGSYECMCVRRVRTSDVVLLHHIAYRLQTLRIERMKLIESPSAFWKNMDNAFLPDIERNLIG